MSNLSPETIKKLQNSGRWPLPEGVTICEAPEPDRQAVKEMLTDLARVVEPRCKAIVEKAAQNIK